MQLQGVAGYTYLGQLLSHDTNKDETSTLGQPVDPFTLPNTNTPFVDADTIYSHAGNQPLLETDPANPNPPPNPNPNKLAIGLSASGVAADFPRDANEDAIIVDGRNDNNRVMGQIQVVRPSFACFSV